MASPTWWTWVLASSGSWRWTGRPGMLQSMGSERVGHDWATELNWTEKFHCCVYKERRVWKGSDLLRGWAMGSGLLGREYFSTDINLPAHGSSKQQASFQSASLSFKNSLQLGHPFLLVSGKEDSLCEPSLGHCLLRKERRIILKCHLCWTFQVYVFVYCCCLYVCINRGLFLGFEIKLIWSAYPYSNITFS